MKKLAAALTLVLYFNAGIVNARTVSREEQIFLQAKEQLDKARTAFESSGSESFHKTLKQSGLSKKDIDFIAAETKGAASIPQMSVEGSRAIITIQKGRGINERITIEVNKDEKNSFFVNGLKYTAKTSVKENYEGIKGLLEEKNSLSLLDLIIPSAHASGGNGSKLLWGGLALAAGAALTFYVIKQLKSSPNLSPNQDGPVVGDPTVVEETVH